VLLGSAWFPELTLHHNAKDSLRHQRPTLFARSPRIPIGRLPETEGIGDA
jgi:hypothetical protein